ncbi:MAG TPA: TlyA family RNA methyltransferase [Bacillota bacterium]|nr:TlyA family RNA methyltransferase [Bacillota bacterium]HOG52671.1 TlyA family RNA methyltransferase [Bacillota bacterium]
MKKRLDTFILEKGLAETREGARRLILAGLVKVDGEVRDKPGEGVKEDCSIEVMGPALKFVSRGGQKLEKALDSFGISLKGIKAMDIGASTGGFTDCMLQRGAVRVYAVDVGYGQLAWKLRQDPRVVVMERTNARSLDPEDFEGGLDFASMDLSFISFLKVLPAVLKVGSDRLSCVILIKPQFEAGRERVGKNGVVRDPAVHEDVLRGAVQGAKGLGLTVAGLDFSPVKGPEGNIEYLMLAGKPGSGLQALPDPDGEVRKVVREAHALLG